MTSRVTIRRKTGHNVQNEETGVEEPQWTVVVSDCPFRLGVSRGFTPPSRKVTIGGIDTQVALRVGHFPSGQDLRDSDMVDITAGENAGTVWQIIEGDSADQLTARRASLISVDRPEEWP